jgi:hypothetical protein
MMFWSLSLASWARSIFHRSTPVRHSLSKSLVSISVASFRSFDDYSEQLLAIGVERLEAEGICETVLFAHSGSDLSATTWMLCGRRRFVFFAEHRDRKLEVGYWDMRKSSRHQSGIEAHLRRP